MESGDEAVHAIRADRLTPFRLGEIAVGFDLTFFRRLQLGEVGFEQGLVLSLDPLEVASLPLVTRPVRDGGAVERLRADLASDDMPSSTGFEGRRKARFY